MPSIVAIEDLLDRLIASQDIEFKMRTEDVDDLLRQISKRKHRKLKGLEDVMGKLRLNSTVMDVIDAPGMSKVRLRLIPQQLIEIEEFKVNDD